MPTSWPDELIHTIACRRCVLFFGSGISMNSVSKDGTMRPPGWADFLESAMNSGASKPDAATKKEVKELIRARDYLTAAELIQAIITPPKFANALKKAFHEPDFQPAEIHNLLFKLDLRLSITPNIDSIYESAVGGYGAGALTTKVYHDDDIADALRRHERVLIKSHGSISTPSKVIFTRSAYAETRNKYSDFYELIDALIRTHALLFVGCGIDDPDIRALLENYRYRHPQGQSHYFVVEAGKLSKSLKSILSESMKVEIIEYPKSTHHAALTTDLKSLVNLVEAKRLDISKTQKW